MARSTRRTVVETPGAGNGDNGNQGTTVGNSIIGSNAEFVVDPAAVSAAEGGGSDNGSGGNTAEQPERKRRGRKPGSRNKTSAEGISVSGIDAILYSSHAMLAAMMKAPMLALDREESGHLAQAIADVSRHYDVQATEKTLAWVNLATALGMVYGPRLVALRGMRKPREKSAEPATPTAQPFMHQPAQVQ